MVALENTPVTDRPRRGRPPGSRNVRPPKIARDRPVDKAASAMAEQHVLPEPPGDKLDWDQMQEYLALLTPAMWSHVLIYVYRVKPKIRRQLADAKAPNYIDCLGEPFTMNYFINRHGGGKYVLQAVDTEQKKQQTSNKLFSCHLQIDEVQHPPVINFAELELDARENRSYITWLQNQGILDGKGNVVQNNASGGIAGNNTDVVKEILNFVKERPARSDDDSLGKAIGTILVERMKQDDPSKQLETVTNLLAALKDDPSKQLQVMTGWLNVLKEMRSDNSASGVYDKFLAMQSDNNKTMFALMERVFQNQKPPQSDMTAGFTQFREVFAFARDLMDSGPRAGRRTGWDIGYDIAKDIGLPALQTIGAAVTNIMALQRGALPVAPGAPGAPPVPVAFDPYANPAAARAYAGTLPQQQPPPQPPPPPAPPAANPIVTPPPGGMSMPDAELVGLFQTYGNLVVTALNNGTPGYEFADHLCALFGNATHAMVTNKGEETLAGAMLALPEIAMFGEQRIRLFVHEFVHFEEFGPEGESEADFDDQAVASEPPRHAARPNA